MNIKALKFTKNHKFHGISQISQKWAIGRFSRKKANFMENVTAVKSWIRLVPNCYQWFKQRLILSISKPSISQRSQTKENTVEPSVSAQDIILWICTLTCIYWQAAGPAFELLTFEAWRLAGHAHCSAVVLPTEPRELASCFTILQ